VDWFYPHMGRCAFPHSPSQHTTVFSYCNRTESRRLVIPIMQHRQHCEQHTPASLPSPRSETPEFLVISLFALRLVKQLIQGLGPYPDREADMAWIAMFLAPYRSEHALARISGARAEDYTATYPAVVSRMKTHPRYPIAFMRLNPDPSMRQHRSERQRPRGMTDGGGSFVSFQTMPKLTQV
jgi:hypothetical protein